jgi:autotransporter family porin
MTLEQQGQLVYQHINLDEARDPYGYLAHRTPDALHGRIGWRLSMDALPWRPYLKANLWQDFAGKDSALYEHTVEIVSRHRSTTLELGGGLVANLAPNMGFWLNADYTTDIGGTEQEREAIRGTAGLRVTW